MELSALSLRLRALSVLRGLLSHPLVRAYGDTLTALDGTAADFADRYGALCATLFLRRYRAGSARRRAL